MSVQVRELDPATSRFVERAEFRRARTKCRRFTRKRSDQADTRYRIALAEGVTSWQVVEALKAMDVLEGDAGDVPPEGVLAPDSYEVRAGDDRAAVLARMREAQRGLAEAWEARDPDLPIESRKIC